MGSDNPAGRGGIGRTVIIAVTCECDRPWRAPVRLSRAAVEMLLAQVPPDTVLATCRCFRCEMVTEHTIAEIAATAR